MKIQTASPVAWPSSAAGNGAFPPTNPYVCFFASLRRHPHLRSWLAAYTAIALALKVNPSISRLYCTLAFLTSTILLLTWRGAFHSLVRDGAIARELRQKAVFIGWNSECTRALVRIQQGRGHPTEIIGIIAPPDGQFQCPPPADIPVLGNYNHRRQLMRDSGADILLAVDGAISRDEMVHLSEVCGRDLIDFKLIPSCFQVLPSNLQLENINGKPVLGIGPALAHGLAKAGEDTAARRRLAATSTGLALLLVLAAMGALAAILLTIPYPVLLGEQFAGKEDMLRPALWLGTAMLGLLLLLNLTDRLREGCLETHANNIWGAVGNVLAAAAVGLGV